MYMQNMTKNDNTTFYVEGPDWKLEVDIDTSIFETEREQLIEAGTKAIEKRMTDSDDVNLGACILVKKGKKNAKEAMVNTYICLNNAARYAVAEDLRKNFKDATNNDLSLDDQGYSY
jgi:hypothetical protein